MTNSFLSLRSQAKCHLFKEDLQSHFYLPNTSLVFFPSQYSDHLQWQICLIIQLIFGYEPHIGKE
jgi:hypothetical protein